MPNSAGCVHAHPDDVGEIARVLQALGVVVRPNPYSGKKYPWTPQGIAVVTLIDD